MMRENVRRAERKKRRADRRGRPEERRQERTDLRAHIPDKLYLNAATTAIAQKWLRATRAAIIEQVHKRTSDTHAEIRDALKIIIPEDDWFFTTDFRGRGEDLEEKGTALLNNREGLLASQESKLRKIRREFQSYEEDKRSLLENERDALEQRLAHERHERMSKLEAELLVQQRARQARETALREELNLKRGDEGEGAGESKAGDEGIDDLPKAAQQELRTMDREIAAHRKNVEADIEEALEGQREVLRQKQAKRQQAIAERRARTEKRLQDIRMETAMHMRELEAGWQRSGDSWVQRAKARIAQKRIQDKEQADREAAKGKRRRRL